MMHILSLIFLILSAVFYEAEVIVTLLVFTALFYVSLTVVKNKIKLIGPIIIPSLGIKRILKYAIVSLSLFALEQVPKDIKLNHELILVVLVLIFIAFKVRRSNDL